ncbi:MAG: hypothetical protein GY777_00070 [Candidatus Brocadiaceae bacterium]|nr:hypothetical protein [Candidatus Brocadiaceae bacterium]
MTKAQELLKKISEAAYKDRPLSEDSIVPNLRADLEESEVKFLKHKLLEAQDTHKLRLNYASRIFLIVCIWLGCVIVGVFLTGFKILGFSLSDKVLIAFITSTTISVLGLFIVVAKWLFPINNKKK